MSENATKNAFDKVSKNIDVLDEVEDDEEIL